jgi:hypothetical protein
MTKTTCAHMDCHNEPTHRQVVRTPIMPASAFYYVCDDHAIEDDDYSVTTPLDPYAHADIPTNPQHNPYRS